MRTQLVGPDRHVLVGPGAYDQLFTMHGDHDDLPVRDPDARRGVRQLPGAAHDRRAGHGVPAAERASASGSSSAPGCFMYTGLVLGQAPDAGWFNYVPLASRKYSPGPEHRLLRARADLQRHLDDRGRVNFIVTIFKLRAPGMSLNRMPLFCFAFLAVVVRAGLRAPGADARPACFLELDRRLGLHFFDVGRGGDPLLWQHLFWIFGHPEVYIIILPAFGIATSIIPTFTRRRMVAFPLVALAEILVAFIGFGVWVHHMFATGLPRSTTIFFAAASLIIVDPERRSSSSPGS